MAEPNTLARADEAVRRMVRQLAGDIDPSGVQVMRLVRMAANQYDARVDEMLGRSSLSGPRWALLLRLMADEEHGRTDGLDYAGMSPTQLSRCQNVSKNTISSLLAGLEDQGLIERTLDREDRRAFQIRLTDAGRTVIRQTAPPHLTYLNRLASGLSPEERSQLAHLLEKLYRSLIDNAQTPPGTLDPVAVAVPDQEA